MPNTTTSQTALAGQNREEHTAIPWLADRDNDCHFEIYARQAREGYRLPAETYGPNAEANAALIVRAVNSHAALVAALDELCQAFAHNIPHASQRPTYLRARAALALAGKEAK